MEELLERLGELDISFDRETYVDYRILSLIGDLMEDDANYEELASVLVENADDIDSLLLRLSFEDIIEERYITFLRVVLEKFGSKITVDGRSLKEVFAENAKFLGVLAENEASEVQTRH